LVSRLDLENNIKFLDFLKDKDKFKIVNKTILLIYPTHEDSYLFVVLESLTVGTPVVSYALLNYIVYKDLPAIRFIKEFDLKGTMNETIRNLK